MIVKPPIRVILGIALAVAACSKADLPMQDLLQDAKLVEVGRIDADYAWDGVYAWARDGKSFVLSTLATRPFVWLPEPGTKLELSGVPELGSICGIGAGIGRTGILCMHGVDTETVALAEINPIDGSVLRTLGHLPRDRRGLHLVANETGDRIFGYSPGDPIHWDLPLMISCDKEFQIQPIDTDRIMFLNSMRWLPNGRTMACIGSDKNCGTGLEEGGGMGGISLLSDDGSPERLIRSGAGGFGWKSGPESNQSLVAFPQEMSVSPDGKSIVYLAFKNKLQRLGLLRTTDLKHTRGHDVKPMHDILHLSNDVLLVSPKGERAMLEIWDAKTFVLRKQTRIPAGRKLLLNHDRTRLAVIDDKQIRAYRCVWTIYGAN
jgi:hypothetical protein